MDINTIASGSATPNRGYWRKGDLVLNEGVAPSGTYGWACTTGGPASQTWAQSTAYNIGDFVRANGNVYVCAVAGTSASVGTGPSGYVFPAANASPTPTLQDGSVYWMWASSDAAAVFKAVPINA